MIIAFVRKKMYTQIPNLSNPTQIDATQKSLFFANRIRSGTNWFFWIGGLSIINTIAFFLGSTFTFVVGLGITQFVDGFMSALAKELNQGWGIIQIIGFVVNVVVAGLFVGCGFLGRKRLLWPVIVGMVLYGLDAIILLVFQDFIGAVFHVIALFGIGKSIKAIKELAILEKSGNSKLIGSTIPQMPSPQNPQTNQKEVQSNWIMVAMVILIVLLLIVIALLLI
jgi:hypothetical protein